ncbi:MAG: hypothetical protein ACE5FQ_11055 [Thiogranum sp.]
MRKIWVGVAFFAVLTVLLYGYLIWKNSVSVTTPGQAELETSLENSIQWVEQNRDAVLSNNNPMLWYMLQQAADITGDQRLQRLFADYEQRYLKNHSNNLWRPLFYPGAWVPIRFKDISSFPYYNWHFLYAVTCDRELGQIAEITAQNEPAFCDSHPLRPGCVTHQMMGMRLLQRIKCGDTAKLDDTVRQLQRRIHKQLVLDPRVGDSYMQRVLMLVESGAANLVKPIWIRNLVDAQQPDGGWSAFQPLLPVGDGHAFGFSQRFFAIKKPHSDFHITAQGVLLFALLTHP